MWARKKQWKGWGIKRPSGPGGRETGEEKEPAVQGAVAGGGGMPFMLEPLQETSGEV
jgi:hypothetical protein